MADTNLHQSQETRKANHDKRVQSKQTFVPGDSIFIETLPPSTCPAERLAAEGYTTLLPRRLRPYHIISVRSKYVKIWHHGIENTVSIRRVTRARREDEEYNNDVTDETPAENSEEQPDEPREKPEQEYALERTVDHNKTKNGPSYRLRWYDCKLIDGT